MTLNKLLSLTALSFPYCTENKGQEQGEESEVDREGRLQHNSRGQVQEKVRGRVEPAQEAGQ